MGLVVKIDSRERLPYEFDLPTRKGTLLVGDYSLVGLEDQIGIERKSVDDLLHCLSRDRSRFEEELRRAQDLDYFTLLIEGTLRDLANGRYRSTMRPKSVIQSVLALSVRYRVPVFFAENRSWGQRITESLLRWYATENTSPTERQSAHLATHSTRTIWRGCEQTTSVASKRIQ